MAADLSSHEEFGRRRVGLLASRATEGMKPKWYISFEAWARVSAQHYLDETKAITTETETKAFAWAIFAKGARLSAGTINL